MSNKHFSRMPNIDIPRTKMKQTFTHSTSFNFGKIVPIDCNEVLPGDTIGLKLSSLIRMTQPLVPIMDTLECSIHAFFCPMRLVYKHTEEFFGENKDSAGYQKSTFTIPQAAFQGLTPADCSAYLGKPVGKQFYASMLKERVYLKIWSDWYRAQQIQDPFVMLDSDDEDRYVGHIGEDTFDGGLSNAVPLMNVCKKFDYFTSATISPQYGEEVLLPLGDYAPVVTTGKNVDPGIFSEDKALRFFKGVDGEKPLRPVVFDGDGDPLYVGNHPIIDGMNNNQKSGKLMFLDEGLVTYGEDFDDIIYPANLWADLSKATASSVNQIRYAFQLQKYLERANFGSRYFEVLASHFGVTSPDARLQRPEYLGGTKFFINIQQVLSTAGATYDDNTKLGQPGANSTTIHQDYLFNKGFVEHGFIMIMLSTRQASHKYSQGILREDSRSNMFDYYFPEFANLGDQAILNKEIYVNEDDDVDEAVFGYQEHWAEYRYRPDRVSGMLNPVVANSEDYWTLANNFDSLPALDSTFIEENRDNLKRALVNGDQSSLINDFIADFYFDYTSVRPLPAYTIPGLIDHFGSR